jgi:hypothetical protein
LEGFLKLRTKRSNFSGCGIGKGGIERERRGYGGNRGIRVVGE